MSKRSRTLVLIVAFSVLASAVVSRFATRNAHADVAAVLQGSVGPDFSISLKNPDGTPVTTLPDGTYEIQVNDQAVEHNFHLEGPGVSMATSVPNVETADWTVNLTDGYYTIHCDQHAALTASFAVGNVPATPAPVPPPVATPAPAAIPVPPVLSAKPKQLGTLKVSATAVTLGGKRVTTLRQGTYRLVTAKSGLVIVQTKGGSYRQVLPRTSSFVLTPGTWKLAAATVKVTA